MNLYVCKLELTVDTPVVTVSLLPSASMIPISSVTYSTFARDRLMLSTSDYKQNRVKCSESIKTV